MPSPTRGLTQPQRVEISSRRLVEAAAELIAEKGWEATTAAEIGRRAGYSRAMVHARYGSKDAILDAFFEHEYVKALMPDPDPHVTGLQQALAHFDRIAQLHEEDPEFTRAIFVATFEAAKTTSALRHRVQKQLREGTKNVVDGLRRGIRDGSVRADVDLDCAANDISAAVFGLAYLWIVLPEMHDLPREIDYVRTRMIAAYGDPSAT